MNSIERESPKQTKGERAQHLAGVLKEVQRGNIVTRFLPTATGVYLVEKNRVNEPIPEDPPQRVIYSGMAPELTRTGTIVFVLTERSLSEEKRETLRLNYADPKTIVRIDEQGIIPEENSR
jgi:hypothetical protein